MKAMYKKIYEELKKGNSVILTSLYKSSGSTPRKAGAKMAYFSDGEILGTVGGGAIEFDCLNLCKNAEKSDFPFTENYVLNNTQAQNIGMVCGGSADIFFQLLTPDEHTVSLFEAVTKAFGSNKKAWLYTNLESGNLELITDEASPNSETNSKSASSPASPPDFPSASPSDLLPYLKTSPVLCDDEKRFFEPITDGSTVYVFGGGHVSQALCKMLSFTDFSVVIYEDNEKFCEKSLFPDAKMIIKGDFLKINENIRLSENDYAVVLTRGHKSDNDVLSQILSKHPSYLGVIGSRKKVGFMKAYLKDCGFDIEDIEKIRSPIGLSIGAVTPAEIAVSITAELIKHRSLK